MLQERLAHFIKQRCCTLLGIGPVSKNVVDASIDLSNEYDIPLFLIASRRQIESRELGSGYVNNWSTEDFADYVFERDKKGKIIMCRDHGGPWQNTFEVEQKYSLHTAMESAKKSFKADIDAGFEILHIDPSVDIWNVPEIDEILLRTFELYEYCWTIAKQQNKKILFEIGMEEQSGGIGTLEDVQYTLDRMREFCDRTKLPFPTFIVIQTGTKVVETKNIGSLSTPFRIAYELPAEIQIPKMIEICNQNNIYLKQHNTDYISNEGLSLYPKLGIHSVNIAPEFGVAETRAFLNLLRENDSEDLAQKFIKIAYDSNKWDKWMLPETTATDEDKAVIAGHYVFSDPKFIAVKHEAQSRLKDVCPDIEQYLVNAVKESIKRYLINFRLLREYEQEESRVYNIKQKSA